MQVIAAHEQETRQLLKDAGFELNNDGTVTSTDVIPFPDSFNFCMFEETCVFKI